MRQLLTGARGIQDRSIVHRDIKPANVLVAQDWESLKICDFGLAISTSDPPPHSEAGTMLYIRFARVFCNAQLLSVCASK
jgi:cell division cycle 2-like protein